MPLANCTPKPPSTNEYPYSVIVRPPNINSRHSKRHSIGSYCAYDISDLLAEGVNLRNICHHLTLFYLMKLFLISFSYIGNVVSAQLIHKETPHALKTHSSMPISTVCPYHWIKLYVVFCSNNPIFLRFLP